MRPNPAARVTQFTDLPLSDEAPAVRMSRRFDPRTSHEAAWKFVESGGRARTQQRIIRWMLEGRDGNTASELTRIVTGAWKRMNELERLGLVRRGLPRTCRVTGMAATTWWLC